ncbi:hypothetical protein NLJ89_g7958 [Agrocybe chaxingu]|uniref:Uncharacterized protein n=1 Tax=Agrocybe chaxingu TaxID=84603 RepID=A0A9W8MT68_9AGAR|nr:hypothetical protein NLJ89_g7958 [Agrocybe chaxingu]
MVCASRALGLDRLASSSSSSPELRGKGKADAQQRAPLVPLDAYLSAQEEDEQDEGGADDGHELRDEHEREDDDGDEDEDEEPEDERRYRPVLRLDERAEQGGEVIGEEGGQGEEGMEGGLGDEEEDAYVGARYRCVLSLSFHEAYACD